MKALLFFVLVGVMMINPSLANSETKKSSSGLPSEPFRTEHVEIKKHLSHVEQWAGNLNGSDPTEQKKTMLKILTFFKEHIKPHAEWEEKKLYPAVDKRASKGAEIFTSTMRYEHKIIGRWVEELEKEATSKSPKAQLFLRKTDQLLGLIIAHFEEEEEVLLPILDKSMTPAEFKEEILSGGGHGPLSDRGPRWPEPNSLGNAKFIFRLFQSVNNRKHS